MRFINDVIQLNCSNWPKKRLIAPFLLAFMTQDWLEVWQRVWFMVQLKVCLWVTLRVWRRVQMACRKH